MTSKVHFDGPGDGYTACSKMIASLRPGQSVTTELAEVTCRQCLGEVAHALAELPMIEAFSADPELAALIDQPGWVVAMRLRQMERDRHRNHPNGSDGGGR